jgi:hypothetical protein
MLQQIDFLLPRVGLLFLCFHIEHNGYICSISVKVAGRKEAKIGLPKVGGEVHETADDLPEKKVSGQKSLNKGKKMA